MAVERFERLFRLAADDEEVRVEAIREEDRVGLRALGPSYETPETLFLLDAADLEATRLGGGTRVSDQLLVFWQSKVWNDFLDAFSRGKLRSEPSTRRAHSLLLTPND